MPRRRIKKVDIFSVQICETNFSLRKGKIIAQRL